jgi:two-component system, oxyanion-binding sensor
MTEKLTIGFIPLVDAASLLVAADFGFARAEGLDIELVREVSWANVREKLSAGLFDAAHMLAPMAVASGLKVVPGENFAAPYVLATNGNAITVSPKLFNEIHSELSGAPAKPLETAKALARIAGRRKREGAAPLTFGSTFPFSCHSYQLRFWMAAGGVDTAADLRLIVLPPPYMVESLKCGEVDGFCVGAPWNSVAADLGLGHILHFGCEIASNLTEKVIAVRSDWLRTNEDVAMRLMRAVSAAAEFANGPENRKACCERLSSPSRIDASPASIGAALSGSIVVGRGGTPRTSDRYLILGAGESARPDEEQAAWFYAQMVRWRQVSLARADAAAAKAVLSSDLFDRTFGPRLDEPKAASLIADGLGLFAGPRFHKDRISEYLAALQAT